MKSIKPVGKMLLVVGVMMLLILDTKTALQGTTQGVELCIRTVIPALFPFFVCSGYLTGNIGKIGIPFLRPLGRLCRIPQGSEGILLVGLLGGYPVGAQAVSNAYDSGALTKKDAHRMLGFCNNAGPSFLFGMLPAFFSGIHIVWVIWLIHILSAIAVGMLLPGGTQNKIPCPKGQGMTISKSMENAIRCMGIICGWVVLFRMILTVLDRWVFWIFPNSVAVLISGLLELTNGCFNLETIQHEPTRFALAILFLSAGGWCVEMQTASVTKDLGMGAYFPGKVLQTGIGLFLCGFVTPVLFPGEDLLTLQLFALLLVLVMLVSLYFGKITVAFSKRNMYNKENMTK